MEKYKVGQMVRVKRMEPGFTIGEEIIINDVYEFGVYRSGAFMISGASIEPVPPLPDNSELIEAAKNTVYDWNHHEDWIYDSKVVEKFNNTILKLEQAIKNATNDKENN